MPFRAFRGPSETVMRIRKTSLISPAVVPALARTWEGGSQPRRGGIGRLAERHRRAATGPALPWGRRGPSRWLVEAAEHLSVRAMAQPDERRLIDVVADSADAAVAQGELHGAAGVVAAPL